MTGASNFEIHLTKVVYLGKRVAMALKLRERQSPQKSGRQRVGMARA